MVQLYSRTIKTINGRLLGDRFRTNIMIHYNQQGQTHNVKEIEIKERGQQNGNVQWIKQQVICRISGGKQKGEFRLFVFCKCKFLKFADKNGEFCISVLEKVAGCPAGLLDAS